MSTENKPKIKTDRLGRWVRGQSGNPSGCTKAKAQARELAALHSIYAIGRMVDMVHDEDLYETSPATSLKASAELASFSLPKAGALNENAINEIKGGVMIVPAISSVDEWEGNAIKQQQKLIMGT